MQPRGGNRQNSETVEKTSVVVVAPSKFSNSIDLNDDFRRVMMRPAPSQAGSGPQAGPSKKVVIKVKMMIRNQTLGWPSQQNTWPFVAYNNLLLLPKYENHRKLIWCYHFVMFITYNQLMWVFKVLFGYDRTPNKSVQPHFGSTNTNCTGHTDRLFMKTPTLSVQREKQKKLLLLDFLSIPIECLRLGRRVGDRQNCKLVAGIWLP